jgi:hypothetical protein
LVSGAHPPYGCDLGILVIDVIVLFRRQPTRGTEHGEDILVSDRVGRVYLFEDVEKALRIIEETPRQVPVEHIGDSRSIFLGMSDHQGTSCGIMFAGSSRAAAKITGPSSS